MIERGARVGFAGVLWLAAAAPPALMLADAQDPGLAVVIAHRTGDVLRWLALGTAALGALALLVYPPFLPAVRIGLRRLRSRLQVDQGPMFNALGRIEHHETADDHFTVAQVAHRLGDTGRALRHLTRAVELDPESLKSRHLLARIALESGHVVTAAEQFAVVVRRDAGFAFGDALLGLGTALERLERDDEARAALEAHEAAHGPNRDALRLRAAIAVRGGRVDEARALLERAAEPLAAAERAAPEPALARARARVALLKLRGRR